MILCLHFIVFLTTVVPSWMLVLVETASSHFWQHLRAIFIIRGELFGVQVLAQMLKTVRVITGDLVLPLYSY